MGADAGAETGPYGILTRESGSRSRQAVAEELFAAHYPRLAGWVRRLVDDDETAHEIASEAFVRLLSKWTSPDKLESPQSYLYMIATNLVRDHWRKMERERRAFSRAAAGTDPEPFSDPSQDVDVRELLAALPDRLREPFLLHYYAGFGIREIAARLRKPEGTIKADLFHARARLKDALAERGARPAGRPVPAQRPGNARGTDATDARAGARGTDARAGAQGTDGKAAGARGTGEIATGAPGDAPGTYAEETGTAGDASAKKGRGIRRGLRRANAG